MMQFFSGEAAASSADAAVYGLVEDYPWVKRTLDKAAGVLVFPHVLKAGMGFGAEYGDGVLMVKGRAHSFYNIIGVSFGFQLGAQVRTVFMLFMTQAALDACLASANFSVGVDASVAVVTLDAGVDLDVTEIGRPIIAFVTDRKGLMYNLTLEGSKITRTGDAGAEI